MERYSYLRVEGHNIVKISVLIYSMYKFNVIRIKILANNLLGIDKMITKVSWSGKRPRIANAILKEKNELRGLTLPDFGISIMQH